MTTTRNRVVAWALATVAAVAAVLTLANSGPAWAAVADLSVRKAASENRVQVGERFVWTVTVANKGPRQAQGVRVVDTLPYSSVRLNNVVASQGGPCQVDFPRVVCSLGTLGVGEKATIKLYVGATEAGALRNRARVSQSTGDSDPTNDKASSTVRAR